MVQKELPTQVSEVTSSVGLGWPPREVAFERVKGFFTQAVLTTETEFIDYLVDFNDMVDFWNRGYVQVYDQVTKPPEHGEVSRFTERIFVNTELFKAVAPKIPSGLLEAFIPLEGAGDGFDDIGILYVGHNNETRFGDHQERAEIIPRIKKVLQRPRGSYTEIMKRQADQGITISALTDVHNPQVIAQMSELYSKFGWSGEAVEELLNNPNNLIMVARDGNKIVSTGLAEFASFPVGDLPVPFKMAEISEAATLEEYQGRGIYTAVAAELTKQLAQKGVHLAYGECNGVNTAVLSAARTTGRSFAYEFSVEAEIVYVPNHKEWFISECLGMLPQHAPIAGVPHKKPYNDLVPAFATRAALNQFAQT